MDFTKLEKNLSDVIYEAQIKLGYDSSTMSMNYPLDSLNRLLGTNVGIDEMKKLLGDFAEYAEERLGRIEFSTPYSKMKSSSEIIRIDVPAKGADYIHEHADKSPFLPELIALIYKKGATIDDVISLFRKYSDKVHVEESKTNEFDYLVYFEDGRPDSYYYCITDEIISLTYHRFTKEDFYAFDF